MSKNILIKQRRVGVIGPPETSLSENATDFFENKNNEQYENNNLKHIKNGFQEESLTTITSNVNPLTQEQPESLNKKNYRSWKEFFWSKLCRKKLFFTDKPKYPNIAYKLRRKNSSEKFAYLNLLTPALILNPLIIGKDNITKPFSQKFGNDFHLEVAAAHINDAINGRGKFGEARALFKPTYIQKCFDVVSSTWWAMLLYFIIGVHCLMVFWEQPFTPVPVGYKWNTGIHPAILAVDAVCLLVYIIDIILHCFFLSWHHVWFAKENMWIRVEFIFTVCFVIDYSILVAEAISFLRLVCPFRCLRASMLLCKSKNVSHIFDVVLSIISKLGKVFLIITIFIVAFSAIGVHIFMTDYHLLAEPCNNQTNSWNCTNVYNGTFDQVAIAAMNMFVLMSTENYPDFMIPAFSKSWVNFFYFGLFLYVGVFFLTAILLAIIVESYWDYSKRHVKQERKQQREELAKAWNLVDPLGKGQINVNDKDLLKLFNILKPKNSDDENRELINYMSMYGDGFIDSYDWTTKIIEALSFVFEEDPLAKQETSIFLKYTCAAAFQKVCQRIMHATTTSVTILVLIVMHSILFCLMWAGITDTTQLAIQSTRTAIVFIFTIEVVLRIVADGKALLNLFDMLDMIMVIIAIVGSFTWYILWFNAVTGVYLGACVVSSSVAILIRAILNSQHARTAVGVLRNIYPVMFDLILLVITILFMYAVIGYEMFQDKTLENSSARGFEGSYQGYGCGVGFETFGCAWLIVFQILVTNDWNAIMLGAFLDAGWPYVFYFLSCYLIVNMIVMNLFVAITIEAYKKLTGDKISTLDKTKTVEPGKSVEENDEDQSKERRSFAAAARHTLTEIFAPTRKRKSNEGSSALIDFTSSPFAVRRGTLASLGLRTPTPSPRMERHQNAGQHISTPSPVLGESAVFTFTGNSPPPAVTRNDAELGEIPKVAESINDSKQKSFELKHKTLKQRGEAVRKRRKTKQEENKIVKETKRNEQLQLDGVVRLKQAVRVIKEFHARNSKEMNLMRGDIVTVEGQKEDMFHGPNGWFPSNYVVQMPQHADEEVNPGQSPPIFEKTSNVKFDVDSLSSSRKQPLTSPAQTRRISQSRMVRKISKMDGAGWRREIHGEITVMNKDELQDLRKMFRGGLERRHTSLSRVPPHLALRANEQTLREEDEEQTIVPEVTVSEANSESEESLDNNPTVTSDTNTLTLNVPQPPRRPARRKNNKGGAMPEWMQKFIAEKQIQMENDVKLEESFSSSANSEEG